MKKTIVCRDDYECSAPGLDRLVDTALSLGALGTPLTLPSPLGHYVRPLHCPLPRGIRYAPYTALPLGALDTPLTLPSLKGLYRDAPRIYPFAGLWVSSS